MNELKRPLALLTFLFCLAACGSKDSGSANLNAASEASAAVATPTSGKYKIKSGIINFELDVMGQKTKKVLYFDDFGSKERSEEYNADGSLKEYRMSDGKTRYTIIPSDKVAYLADENGAIGWEMQFMPWSGITQQSGYEKDYQKMENITVAGKDCESYSYGGSNVFAGWNGVTLYHKQGKIFTMQATSVDENATIDAGLFEVPEGFEVKKLSF